MSEDLETVKKKYKLSEEEHKEVEEQIKRIYLFDKYPVENPKAIIDIAPPASGKTGLNGYGAQKFEDNNVIIINGDELKPYHPKTDEIAKLYPEYYAQITEQESSTWTSALFDLALQEGYNIIFEGTGKNCRILNTIKEKMKRYNVTVRGMAVNEVNCLISILERYEYQVSTKGWGRLVTLEHFYNAYNCMPNTIDAIEKSKIINNVEVYKRGIIPTQPIKIYDSKETEIRRFPNAKYATLGGRLEDKKNAIENFYSKFGDIKDILESRNLSGEEKKILSVILKIKEDWNKEEKNRD